ncbi:MAG: DUF2071 domain-containing protein [Bryobacterales bacterium]|nr:DUF2071 domain-containing protein [Bryobacterales bacterium]
MSRPFLTAEWRHLAMLNFAIDPEVPRPRVPAGTELDSWRGETLVSLVGFQFLNTRLRGVPIPFHRDFNEVNLRFYVRREAAGELRRGVVFIREVVPRAAIAAVARWVYNEPYAACPMRGGPRDRGAGYAWRHARRWNSFDVSVEGEPRALIAGSEAEFITEHYWGYTRQRDGGTVEYEVRHPPWRVWTALEAQLDVDVRGFYGDAYAEALAARPRSSFLASGSAVEVMPAGRLPVRPR